MLQISSQISKRELLIEKRRTLHFAQSQLRCCGRNIGQQLTPRLTALGEVVDQQPHERFEVQRFPMAGGVVTFVPCQEWLEWLEKYVKRGTIFFGVTWFSHYAAPLAGLQHVLPDDSLIVKLLYGRRLSGQYCLEGDILTIRGELRAPLENVGYLFQEGAYGPFSRTLTLNVPVEADQAEAMFENGVLTLTLPKAAETKPKIIKVKSK